MENASDSVWSNTLTNTWSVSFSVWKLWNCANFDWSNKRLSLSNSGWISSSSNNTWSFWVKPNSLSWYMLDICDSTYWKRVILYWDTGSKVTLWVWWNTLTSTSIFSLWTYYSIRITKSGSSYQLFVNEVSQGTVSMWSGTTTQNYFSIWSAWDSFGANTNWQIDAFWLWNVVLSTGEWSELYNSWAWIEHPFTLETNIVAYYKMDESSGNSLDSVWSNTLINANVSYSGGKINNGANFNGSSSSLLSSTKPVSIANGNACTIAGWVKLSGTGSSQFIFDVVSTDNLRQITIDKNASNTVSGFLYANSVQRVSWSSVVDTSNTLWYHVALSKNTSDLLTLFVNGSQVWNITVSGTQNLWASGGIWVWRHSWATANYLNGSTDELWIWQRELSLTEIQKLYNAWYWTQYPFILETINPEILLMMLW